MSRAQATLTTYGVLKVCPASPPTVYGWGMRAVMYGPQNRGVTHNKTTWLREWKLLLSNRNGAMPRVAGVV